MATNSSCSGCNSCAGCYGALGCVSGPLTHCPRCAAGNVNYESFPYYSGPCAPGPYPRPPWIGGAGCGCGGDCGCRPPRPEPRARVNTGADAPYSGDFSAPLPLLVEAESALPLRATGGCATPFTVHRRGIRLPCPGCYLVIYTVNTAENVELRARFNLALNGSEIPGSALDVVTRADDTSSSFTAHVSFSAPADSILSLYTDREIALERELGDLDPIRLTLLRLR